eukprot:4770859-Pleurochrysis_carterae.AAC.1
MKAFAHARTSARAWMRNVHIHAHTWVCSLKHMHALAQRGTSPVARMNRRANASQRPQIGSSAYACRQQFACMQAAV